MFFVDKYSPKCIDDVFLSQDRLNMLKAMSKDSSLPHIIFYGPEGSGKKTVIKLFLEMIFDKHVNKLCDTTYVVSGSNSNTNVVIKQSDYHIVIEPTNTNFDRYLIQDIVKEYAKRVPLGVFTTKKQFKVVLINNIDNLSYYAQTSLRRTMEKYSGTCRFIMWSRSLSKVIDPLRSRSFLMRINAPTDKSILGLTLDVARKENIRMDLKKYSKILEKSKGNIRKVLWYLQFAKLKESTVTSYDIILDNVVNTILKKDVTELLTLRNLIYRIMITNIEGTCIVKDIVVKLLKHKDVPMLCKFNIAEHGAKYEHNMIRGRRTIIHVDAFITSVIKTLNM